MVKIRTLKDIEEIKEGTGSRCCLDWKTRLIDNFILNHLKGGHNEEDIVAERMLRAKSTGQR